MNIILYKQRWMSGQSCKIYVDKVMLTIAVNTCSLLIALCQLLCGYSAKLKEKNFKIINVMYWLSHTFSGLINCASRKRINILEL